MANERLYQFPPKTSPVPADIIFAGDSADAFDEVMITIAQLISAYPNLSGIAALTLGANTYAYSNNTSVITAGTITALGVSLLADTTIAAMQTTLGYTSTATASLFAGWDANLNLSANNFLSGYATTVTAAATTTLTVGSAYRQYFTGTTTQACAMPVVTGLALGQTWRIVNNSTGVVTVQSSGGNTIIAMAGGTTADVTCILQTGTTAASWSYTYVINTELVLPLTLANGGTAAALTASNGGILYSTATTLAILAATTTANQLLMSGASGAPAWSTATYPATITANSILFAGSNNTITGLGAGNSQTLRSSSAGVISFTSPNIVTSTSCGSFVGGGGAGPTQITNLSVSLTTVGRPVMIMLVDDGSGSGSSVECSTTGSGTIYFFDGATKLTAQLVNNTVSYLPVSAFTYIYTPAAGAHTITAQYSNAANNLNITNAKLVAYEM